MANTTQFNIRLPSGLFRWLQWYARTQTVSQTEVVRSLLEALQEGRVIIRPRGPEAFPAEAIEAGSTPEFPLLIVWGSELFRETCRLKHDL